MSESGTGDLDQDTVFDLLSSARRRFVLYYLRDTDRTVELGELADEVAAWENDTAIDALTSQQRKRVYVSLYQTHIPKLEAEGIIEYNSDSGAVSLAPDANEMGAFLNAETEEVPWQDFYLGLVVLSVLFYAVVSLNVWLFAGLGEVIAGGVIVGAFGVLALSHYVYTRLSGPSLPEELVNVE